MLPKHPDQLTDAELEAWVRRLVDEKVPEGPLLDYKELKLEGQWKREAAKDISSFANEKGGTIIYGIPEDRQSEETAVPTKPYGTDPVPGLREQLENVYVDSVIPRLPETPIRKIELTEYPGKVVYVVWTPESWLAPHMVSAYREKRYYRRGQLRAVPMEEHEVRQRYERTQRLKGQADEFIDSQRTPFGSWYYSFSVPRRFGACYILCPQYLEADRVQLLSGDMRQWLEENPYVEPGGSGFKWIPCVEGVEDSRGMSQGKSRIYRTGAITRWGGMPTVEKEGKLAAHLVPELKYLWNFLKFGASFYRRIAYYGPLRFHNIIVNPENRPMYLSIPFDFPVEWPSLRHSSGFPYGLDIDLQLSSTQLFTEPKSVMKAIADQLWQYFGIWEAPTLDDQFWAPIWGKG